MKYLEFGKSFKNKKIFVVIVAISIYIFGVFLLKTYSENSYLALMDKMPNKTGPEDLQQSSTISVPTPTPTPIPPLFEGDKLDKALLLSTDDRIILVSDFNGKNIRRLLDEDGKTGFVGLSHQDNNIYYTKLNENEGSVYKYNFFTKEKTILLSFNDPVATYSGRFYDSVSLSHDQKYLAYSTGGDIYLFDIANESSERILTSGGNCETYNENCYSFYYPEWSPDDKHILLYKILYEGGLPVVINPFERPVSVTDLRSSAGASWSPNGKMIAMFGGGYGEGSLYLLENLSNRLDVNLLENGEIGGSFVNSAVWLDDNRIAFNFRRIWGKNIFGIGIYNLNNKSIDTLIKKEKKDRDLYYLVEQYLPENNTLYFELDSRLHTLRLDSLEVKELPLWKVNILQVIP